MRPPARRRTQHPARLAIYAAGWPSLRNFCAANGIPETPLSNALNGQTRPYPKLRRQVAAALGVDETVVFPQGGEVFRPEPLPEPEVVA